MHNIVVATTPGVAKRDFVNSLHRASGGRVGLVILQRERPAGFLSRLWKAFRHRGLGLILEAWHALRFSAADARAIDMLKERTKPAAAREAYDPPTLETFDINRDEKVREAMEKLEPGVLVIWGGKVIKGRLLKRAGIAVNMHAGRCPEYRGASANQHALLEGRREMMGVTLHEAIPDVDSGRIFEIVSPDPALRPPDVFRDLNDRAAAAFEAIAVKLLDGQAVPSAPQPPGGRVYLNKDYTYAMRREVARLLRRWAQPAGGSAP